MKFAIYNKEGKPITMDELNREVAQFWKVNYTKTKYVSPKGYFSTWLDTISTAIAGTQSNHWIDVIGFFTKVATVGASIREASFEGIIDALKYYKPYIELCLYWKAQGYTPVSC